MLANKMPANIWKQGTVSDACYIPKTLGVIHCLGEDWLGNWKPWGSGARSKKVEAHVQEGTIFQVIIFQWYQWYPIKCSWLNPIVIQNSHILFFPIAFHDFPHCKLVMVSHQKPWNACYLRCANTDLCLPQSELDIICPCKASGSLCGTLVFWIFFFWQLQGISHGYRPNLSASRPHMFVIFGIIPFAVLGQLSRSFKPVLTCMQ